MATHPDIGLMIARQQVCNRLARLRLRISVVNDVKNLCSSVGRELVFAIHFITPRSLLIKRLCRMLINVTLGWR